LAASNFITAELIPTPVADSLQSASFSIEFSITAAFSTPPFPVQNHVWQEGLPVAVLTEKSPFSQHGDCRSPRFPSHTDCFETGLVLHHAGSALYGMIACGLDQ
jgi:hypothetical protein